MVTLDTGCTDVCKLCERFFDMRHIDLQAHMEKEESYYQEGSGLF